ncbi:beta-1,6-N-acetylglucosaminyltransferase [Capnocytophaga leadbetteri]|jgi:glycosyl transferase family 14|uniref:beta-1,6-N-acetylglucosaminyltransferase n=1 Tax=Capnocytophaga leadbetteri TaxID=327575 RepID=UPI0026ED5548|nr:beta-1,6-N-acetylglucosaminyltransferase [Capnocytophaga leadbetteri]
MQKNYLILAHKNPEQLCRMIKTLDDGVSTFFIHVDAKVAIEPFKALLQGEHIVFIDKRERCVWGGFLIVQATLHLMEAAAKAQSKGFFILMSGQDYPIKPIEELNVFLERNQEYDFMKFAPLESCWERKLVKDKLERYQILHSERRGNSDCYPPFYQSSIWQKFTILWHLVKRRLSLNNFKILYKASYRKAPFMQLYAGSQWWALSEKTFYTLLDYLSKNGKEMKDYFQFTSCPDEIYFQSILVNLQTTHKWIKIKPSITYVNWEREGVDLPVLFRKSDLEELSLQKDKFFARKFDTNIDEEILNLIDKTML